METFNLLVLSYTSSGQRGDSTVMTSTVIPFTKRHDADKAALALVDQSPKGGVYLVVYRCYPLA